MCQLLNFIVVFPTSLHKNLPRQIFQRTQGKPYDYEGNDSGWLDFYDVCFDDSDPQSQQQSVSCNENWYNDPSYTEESEAQYADNTKPPIPPKYQYADTDNVYDEAYSYCNKNDEQNDQIAVTSEVSDSWVPPVTLAKKSTEECINGKNNAPPTAQGMLDLSESSMPRSSYAPLPLPEHTENVNVEYVNIQYTRKSDIPSIRFSSQIKDTCKESDFVKFNTFTTEEAGERGFDSGCISIEAHKKRESPVYVNVRDIKELDIKPPPLPPRNY